MSKHLSILFHYKNFSNAIATQSSDLCSDQEFYKTAFEIFDTNGDGILSDDEVGEFLTYIGVENKNELLNELKKRTSDPKRGCLAGKYVYQVIL